jgi:hypothetical protein
LPLTKGLRRLHFVSLAMVRRALFLVEKPCTVAVPGGLVPPPVQLI